jgi:aminopeptidase YwaD
MKLFQVTFSALFLLCQQINAQQVPFNYDQILPQLVKHVEVLAHDSMEGRLVGTAGEAKAYQYIQQQLQLSGVAPLGTDGYLQPFSFNRYALTASGTLLEARIGKKQIKIQTVADGYPISISGSGNVKAKAMAVGYGINSGDGAYNDYSVKRDVKGKIVVLKHGYPSQFHVHSSVAAAATIEAKVDSAIARGALAVVVVATDTLHAAPRYRSFVSKENTKSIPVVFVYNDIYNGLNGSTVSVNVSRKETNIQAHNVVGYIDNKAQHTLVIGAHFDHLGYDEFGHSTWKPRAGERPSIHNGADDNASGTAALLVFADLLKKYGSANLNYQFIAFSGEEEGLLGSNYYVKNPTVPTNKILAMLNMDMVGRLDMEKYTLGISGTGTAMEWERILNTIKVDSLKYKYTASGNGGSDHASFYFAQVPVLHYFTGMHYDYHKPSDDADKINYEGMYKVLLHIYQLSEQLNTNPNLTYQTVKEDTARVSFKVTLGIMPDYMYDGEGILLEGVTTDRPAHKAGMLKGDKVMQLGTHKINSMQDYMKALSQFSKGETIDAIIIRNGKQLTLPVTF